MSINTRAKLVIPITTSHPELGWDSNRKVPGMTRTGRYEALDVEVPNNRCVRGRSSTYILMFLGNPNFTKMFCHHPKVVGYSPWTAKWAQKTMEDLFYISFLT